MFEFLKFFQNLSYVIDLAFEYYKLQYKSVLFQETI